MLRAVGDRKLERRDYARAVALVAREANQRDFALEGVVDQVQVRIRQIVEILLAEQYSVLGITPVVLVPELRSDLVVVEVLPEIVGRQRARKLEHRLEIVAVKAALAGLAVDVIVAREFKQVFEEARAVEIIVEGLNIGMRLHVLHEFGNRPVLDFAEIFGLSGEGHQPEARDQRIELTVGLARLEDVFEEVGAVEAPVRVHQLIEVGEELLRDIAVVGQRIGDLNDVGQLSGGQVGRKPRCARVVIVVGRVDRVVIDDYSVFVVRFVEFDDTAAELVVKSGRRERDQLLLRDLLVGHTLENHAVLVVIHVVVAGREEFVG